MAKIQITSAASPFDSWELARRAVQVISYAQGMGLLRDLHLETLDLPSFKRVIDSIATTGVGKDLQAALATATVPRRAELLTLLGRLLLALEESPAPDTEWEHLEDLFGLERLAGLLGISTSSARRYRAGERQAPEPIEARLHFLATVVGDLAGAYNDLGIRRWFDRRRSLLNGQSPSALLGSDWTPEDEGPRRVRELARSLSASSAT